MAKYLRACSEGAYHLKLWEKGGARPGPGGGIRARWFCRSWRHHGRCAVERNQEDFRRIREALKAVPAEEVVFLVLTFDPAKYPSVEAQYRELKDRWRSFAKAVRRQWGRMRYVSTVERTRAGRPHLNVLMHVPKLGEALGDGDGRRLATRWAKEHAVGCGFGWSLSLERARSVDELSAYLVKLADAGCVDEAGRVSRGTVGEIAKLSQLPRNAPPGFRRLRSSPGFLPPAKKESEYTGELVKAPHPADLPPGHAELLRAWEAHEERIDARRLAFIAKHGRQASAREIEEWQALEPPVGRAREAPREWLLDVETGEEFDPVTGEVRSDVLWRNGQRWLRAAWMGQARLL